jgi:8-oxo-dGTP diphosphatase
MPNSKPIGTSIIFLNSSDDVLLMLRDDIPHIKYPNMWDIPGGQAENDETPEKAIIREIKEEMDLDLTDIALFERREFSDRTEFTFWKRIDFDADDIMLNEGQCIKWFNVHEIENMSLAFNFNITLINFFDKKPYNLSCR